MRIVALATGVGNLRSVLRAVERATSGARDATITASADPRDVRAADALVVPGQGAFGAFAAAVEGSLRDALLDRIAAGTPYLGICLGMQILFDESEEAPGVRGLGVLRGRVRRLAPGVDPATGRARPLPHVGWNRAEVAPSASASIVTPDHYYFAHSYAVWPEDPDVVLSQTQYGEATFASAVQRGRALGVQFHPEKSQAAGLGVIERFFRDTTMGAR